MNVCVYLCMLIYYIHIPKMCVKEGFDLNDSAIVAHLNCYDIKTTF